jgi:hypothetical protein
MSENQSFAPTNPLAKHFRQPAIYLKLPSQGSHWPEEALELPLNGEIGVLPMSTRDEITLRTPDALLNGQGVVSVVESCCPNIKNAWLMPSVDVDAIVIAIRIASYGNEMEFGTVCPNCNETNDYNIDLGVVLSNIHAPLYTEKVEVSELKIKLKPQSYANVNKSNMIQFEEQQLLRTVRQLDENPAEVKVLFDQQIAKLIDLNVLLLASSTDYIEMPDGSIVNDQSFIEEFYKNCDTKIVKTVRSHIDKIAVDGGIAPLDVICPSCDHKFPVAIEFDYASFFAKGS